MNRLQAVNYILQRCGLGPVSALQTDTASEASWAEQEYNRSSLNIHSVGWHWNTWVDKELFVDANGNISAPTGTITLDSYGTDADRDIALVGDLVYDLDNNTFDFTGTTSMRFKIVVLHEPECIPYPFRHWIVEDASFQFISTRGTHFLSQADLSVMIGNIFRSKLAAEAAANRFNANEGNENILETDRILRVKGNRYRDSYGVPRGVW